MSSAAKKAWATRKRKYGKGGLRKSKVLHRKRTAPGVCYTVENGKVITHPEPFKPSKPVKIYYSTREAQEVAGAK